MYISDGIKTCTSLRTVCVRGEIANKIAGLPNLKTIAILFDEYGRYSDGGLCVPIDTMILASSRDDGYHSVGTTYCNFKPRYIINSKGETTLNAYEPNRTDYKGINILPRLSENAQINTPENLDISDVHVIPSGYFKNGTMKTIKFSEHLRCIHSRAFANCKNITSIVFPGENTKLNFDSYNVFGGCTKLKEIHFCGPVIIKDMNEGNRMTLTFDKPSSICIKGPSSPFDHFVFNTVPIYCEIGGEYGAKFTDVVSYIEIPKGSKEQFLAVCKIDGSKSEYEKCIFEQGAELKSYDIKVEKPGTILSYLPMTELENIDSLTITGFLYETDIKIIEKCNRLSYLNLGKTVVTYSPELLKKHYAEREALGALFGMLGAMADTQYDNYEMGALDHAYTKAFVSLVQQDASSVKKGSEKSIIPAGSFSKMNFLKTVILPYRVVQIRDKVLSDCPNLEHVELPLYLESIGKDCFKNCTRLKDIKFPQSLNCIESGCFENCNSIEVVDLSHCLFTSHRNYVSWNDVFANCLRLKELRLPQGITYLDWIRCAKRINENNPHILKVYFPNTVKDGEGIMLHNYGNCELHFKSENAPESLGEAASGCKVVIYCPKGSTTSYFNAVGGKLERIKIIEE